MELATLFTVAIAAFIAAVISNELASYFKAIGWKQSGATLRCLCFASVATLGWAGWNIYSLS